MSSDLACLGIRPTSETLAGHAKFGGISVEEFRDLAEVTLRELAPIVLSEIAPHLEDYPARLHSSGFRVRMLGSHKVLGSLRWHEYHPDMSDQREPWGLGAIDATNSGEPVFDGGIHDHAWGVASRVLYGERDENGRRSAYSDRIYTVKPAPDEQIPVVGTNGFFRVYKAHYVANQQVTVETDGTIVQAISVKDRRIEVGEGHFIPPGSHGGDAWHVPFSSKGLLVTLCFNSPRMQVDGPHILIAGPRKRYITHRRYVSLEETLHTKAKVLGDS